MVLEVREVSRRFRRGTIDVWALRSVSMALGPGQTLAVMGPSGSGKTTLLNVLAGLDRPTEGDVRVDGTRLADLDDEAATAFRRRHIGFVFQFFNLLPTMTAADNVAIPLLAERLGRTEVESRTAQALAAVGMAHRAAHRPDELSGGEQQRVGIARALVMRPRLLLADEPTGNLDSASSADILDLFRRLVEACGTAIVMVTHAPEAARAMDRVLELRDGAVVARAWAGRGGVRAATPCEEGT
jgi:putative ABC transport system ATP-binding protein